MALTLNDIRNLIRVAQEGNATESAIATTDLLMEIIDEHMDRHLARYRGRTVSGMDDDDINQIFLIGCSEAIQQADPRIGNPLLFIIRKGKWKVADELRRAFRRDLRQYCHACGSETRLMERAKVPICPVCGAEGDEFIERVRTQQWDDGALAATVGEDSIPLEEMVISREIVGRFRERLHGRKLDVFDLIMVAGVDRDSSQNYIKEIAEILGVAPANVNLRLRQIKQEWEQYISEVAAGIDDK